MESPKKRLHNAQRGAADFASGQVRSHGFLSVNTLVGVIVQLDHSSVQGDSRKQTLGSGIRVDCGFQQNVGPDFCLSPDGSGRCGSVCADLQLAFEQWHDSVTVCKDHDHIRRLDSELKAETSSSDFDEQRCSPAAVDVSLGNQAFAIPAAMERG